MQTVWMTAGISQPGTIVVIIVVVRSEASIRTTWGRSTFAIDREIEHPASDQSELQGAEAKAS